MTTASRSGSRSRCTAFDGPTRIAAGDLADVARQAKATVDRDPLSRLLLFDDSTGEVVDVDFRGTAADVVKRLQAGHHPSDTGRETDAGEPPRGPGRPRLGVVAREVTLLPRHWAWLNSQPGGASVALRRLVDEARKTYAGRDRRRRSQEAAYRFMSAMAGDRPGFEEAARALFASDRDRFDSHVRQWPIDVQRYAHQLAEGAFA